MRRPLGACCWSPTFIYPASALSATASVLAGVLRVPLAMLGGTIRRRYGGWMTGRSEQRSVATPSPVVAR